MIASSMAYNKLDNRQNTFILSYSLKRYLLNKKRPSPGRQVITIQDSWHNSCTPVKILTFSSASTEFFIQVLWGGHIDLYGWIQIQLNEKFWTYLVLTDAINVTKAIKSIQLCPNDVTEIAFAVCVIKGNT